MNLPLFYAEACASNELTKCSGELIDRHTALGVYISARMGGQSPTFPLLSRFFVLRRRSGMRHRGLPLSARARNGRATARKAGRGRGERDAQSWRETRIIMSLTKRNKDISGRKFFAAGLIMFFMARSQTIRAFAPGYIFHGRVVVQGLWIRILVIDASDLYDRILISACVRKIIIKYFIRTHYTQGRTAR